MLIAIRTSKFAVSPRMGDFLGGVLISHILDALALVLTELLENESISNVRSLEFGRQRQAESISKAEEQLFHARTKCMETWKTEIKSETLWQTTLHSTK